MGLKTAVQHNSLQDSNRFPSIIAVSGTAGTADTSGTAEIVRVGADPSLGALYVYNLGPAGSVSLGNTPGGTLNEVGTVLGVGGVVQVSGTVSTGGAGTQPVNVVSGTIQTLGTVTEIGSISNIGVLHAGTVTTTLALNTGTITTGSLSNIAMLHAGTVDISSIPQISVGTLPTINVSSGTVTANLSDTDNAVLDTIDAVLDTINAKLVSGTVIGDVRIAGSEGVLIQQQATTYETKTLDTNSGAIKTAVELIDNACVNTGAALSSSDAPLVVIGLRDSAGNARPPVGMVDNADNQSVSATGATLRTGALLYNFDGTAWDRARGDSTDGLLVNLGTNNDVTVTSGSIGNVAILHAGTITTVTSVSNLVGGTILSSGTTTGVGVVSNLTNGSVRMTVGTLTTGSITNVANLLTQTAGTLNTLGTVGVVNNIVTGTLASVKINANPVQAGTPYHVRGTTGAAVWGTILAASGAGTKHYVSGLDIVIVSGTVDVAVTYIGVGGSAGAGVLERGVFAQNSGLVKSYPNAISSGTNGTVAYWLGGAGTVDLNIQYWDNV